MEKIEYSDLYKFLVSIGVALIAISILVLWLFFREPFDLLIEKDKLNNLTELAKIIITTRQGLLSRLMCFIPWLSLLLFLLGLASIILGLIKWWPKQHLLDVRDKIINEKLQKELQKLSEAEVIIKAETAYKETVQEPEKAEEKKNNSAKEQYIESYLKVEQLISDKLKFFFSDKYRIFTNYRLKQYEYDIILNTPLKRDKDKIIEIKFYPQGASSGYIISALQRLDVAIKSYQKTIKKKVKPILIIIVPADKYNIFTIAKLKTSIAQTKQIAIDTFSIHFISENSLNDLTKEYLSSIIEND